VTAGRGRERTGRGWLALLVAGSLALAALPSRPARAEVAFRLPPSRPGQLVDATGRPVGRVIDLIESSRVQAVVGTGGRHIVVEADADTLRLPFLFGQVQAVFEEPGCAGPAYIFTLVPASLPLFDLVAVGPGDAVLAVDGPLVPKSIRSIFDLLGDPACLDQAATLLLVQPAARAFGLRDFQPPFTIR
jgi:hypothetical protein